MKKRILGLLLALCLVVGLLPVMAMAEASATADFYMANAPTASTNEQTKFSVPLGETKYLSATPLGSGTTLRTTITEVTANDNWCVKIEYPNDGKETVNITLKDATLYNKATNNYKCLTLGSTDNNNFNVNIYVEGTNTLTIRGAATDETNGWNKKYNNAAISSLLAAGRTTTITSVNGGILDIDGVGGKNNQRGIYSANDLVLKDAIVNIDIEGGTSSDYAPCIMSGGNITIDGGIVNLTHGNKISTIYASGSTKLPAQDGGSIGGEPRNITIRNGAVVNSTSGTLGSEPMVSAGAFAASGAVIIDRSDVTIAAASADKSLRPIAVASSTVINEEAKTYVAEFVATITNATAKIAKTADTTAAEFVLEDYTAAVAASTEYRYMKITHECYTTTGDTDCTTADNCSICGAPIPAESAHKAPEKSDCTKDAVCTNPGCTYVFTPASATEHKTTTAQTDCTVAVKCDHCDQIAIAAKEHTVADDGDCTTAEKCSVCNKEVTAAKAAHTYTDNTDASCNNAGCTKTRVVETPKPGTNGSPATGDTMNLTLWFSLMAVSVIGFVSVLVISKKKVA